MVHHVGKLVRQDTSELTLVHELQDALRHRHRGVLGTPAGREGVGLHHVRYVDLGHRHVVELGELSNDAVELWVLGLARGLRPRGGDRDLVGEPEHREVEEKCDAESGDRSARAADQLPDHDEEAAESGDQDDGLQVVPAGLHL